MLKFLAAALCSLFALGLDVMAAGLTKTSVRPNFLFIYTDDQRWDAMGVVQREQGERARFPWFTTPNMDRLAAEGVRFRNAFVISALCSPSRAAFLTGRYNHLNGIANNHTPFPTNSVTHATLLRAAGYKTGYIGKWHMDGQRERPGFDFAASYVAHGRYTNCPFLVNGMQTPTEGWVDDVSTDFAIDFLKQNKTQSFSLIVGYKSPHGPFSPPQRLREKFGEDTPSPARNATHVAPYKGKIDRAGRRTNAAPSTASDGSNLEARTRMIRNYLRTIAGVDENLGRLLAALDELKLTGNTLVVYTSDNGFYLGEHGLGDKRSAYDESMRIPLLVRFPKLGDRFEGKVLDALVLNIDLAPTFLDFARVPVPAQMQGRSWRPLLEGKTTAWRRAFFYEYFYETNFAIPTTLALRTENAKLIRYPGLFRDSDLDDGTELFDLTTDPYETNNLARHPAHAKLFRKMQAEFDKQARAVEFRVPDYADERKQL
jgi:arylsulfatase A-like enzyme